MGFWSVPVVQRKPWGVACLVCNILLPGFGTLVAAGYARDQRQLLFGLLQFLFFWLLFLGWIWSIVWGVLIFLRSE